MLHYLIQQWFGCRKSLESLFMLVRKLLVQTLRYLTKLIVINIFFFIRILYEPFKDTQIGFANFFQNDTNNLTDDYYKSAVYKFDRNFRPRSEKKLRVDLSEKYRDLNDKDNPRPKLRSGGSRPSVSFKI